VVLLEHAVQNMAPGRCRAILGESAAGRIRGVAVGVDHPWREARADIERVRGRLGKGDSTAMPKLKVHFFFKQWGGKRKHETRRELDGRTYDAMPILTDYQISGIVTA
jgi:hypothetical protein